MDRVLLVEDDVSLGETLSHRLNREGYAVTWTQSVAQSEACLKQPHPFEIALIDVSLPDGDGFGLAQQIAAQHDFPLIFLTAMSSPEFRLEGYELGAADYIPKPFHLKELLLRLKRVLGQREERVVLERDGLQLLPDEFRVVLSEERSLTLSKRDFELLYSLVSQSPKVVSRQEVLEQIWKGGKETTGRTVDNSVSRLRQLLGEPWSPWLQSIRGVGYQWLPHSG